MPAYAGIAHTTVAGVSMYDAPQNAGLPVNVLLLDSKSQQLTPAGAAMQALERKGSGH